MTTARYLFLKNDGGEQENQKYNTLKKNSVLSVHSQLLSTCWVIWGKSPDRLKLNWTYVSLSLSLSLVQFSCIWFDQLRLLQLIAAAALPSVKGIWVSVCVCNSSWITEVEVAPKLSYCHTHTHSLIWLSAHHHCHHHFLFCSQLLLLLLLLPPFPKQIALFSSYCWEIFFFFFFSLFLKQKEKLNSVVKVGKRWQ